MKLYCIFMQDFHMIIERLLLIVDYCYNFIFKTSLLVKTVFESMFQLKIQTYHRQNHNLLQY